MNLALKRIAQFLDRHPDICNIIIWGNGQLGNSIARLIRRHYGNEKYVVIVDSSVNEQIEHAMSDVLSVRKLKHIECDCLIVASIEYEEDILTVIEQEYPQLNSRVFAFSRDPELNKIKRQDLNALPLEQLYELTFLFPECADIWRALASATTGESSIVFAECASAVSQSEGL